MTIRPARLADAPAIAILTTQLGYPTNPAETEERLGGLLEQADGVVLVAEEAGEVIGWGHVVGAMRLETGRTAELVGLVIDESHRGRGTGAALVQAATDW